MLSERVREVFSGDQYHLVSDVFRGFHGEEVAWLQVWGSFGKDFSVVCSAVNNLLFLDSRINFGNLPEESQTVLLHNFQSFLGDAIHAPYIGLSAYAFQSLELKERTLLDLGCGDGLLGLVALKKGADKVWGVEREYPCEKIMKKHLHTNLLSKKRYAFVHRDLQKKGLERQIPVHDVSVVVANLGPHYSGADVAAIEFLEHLPNCEVFVGGGYSVSNHNKKSPFSAMTALSLLRERGFKYVLSARENNGDLYYRRAFIASRVPLSKVLESHSQQSLAD